MPHIHRLILRSSQQYMNDNKQKSAALNLENVHILKTFQRITTVIFSCGLHVTHVSTSHVKHFISCFILKLHLCIRRLLSNTHPPDKHTSVVTLVKRNETHPFSTAARTLEINMSLDSCSWAVIMFNLYLGWGIRGFVCPVHNRRCAHLWMRRTAQPGSYIWVHVGLNWPLCFV